MTTAEKILHVMEQLQEEENWLDYYNRAGIAAPKTEENIANLRAKLATLRNQTGMTWGKAVQS